MLAAGLLAAGVLVPLAAAASARQAARRAASARGELGAAVTDLMNGAAELHAFGAIEAGLDRARAADAELAAAADRARLLGWISSLPRGWDTPVGTHGTALSGGQRQRLALARALLVDPALLVLDEPTAHLDPENRRALTADLLAATAGRSTLLITHDLEGLDQVDEIVVLDHGRVVERGNHAQLIRSGGAYQRLWEAQRRTS